MKDPRRQQERADAQMIREDHHAMANASEQVINREWNRVQNPDTFMVSSGIKQPSMISIMASWRKI